MIRCHATIIMESIHVLLGWYVNTVAFEYLIKFMYVESNLLKQLNVQILHRMFGAGLRKL